MAYNLTDLENARGLYETAVAVNGITNGLFWGLSLIVFGVILFIIAKYNGTDSKVALIIIPLMLTILAGLSWILGFLPVNVIFYPALLFMGALLTFKFWSD